jgi:hypothetical protein
MSLDRFVSAVPRHNHSRGLEVNSQLVRNERMEHSTLDLQKEKSPGFEEVE